MPPTHTHSHTHTYTRSGLITISVEITNPIRASTISDSEYMSVSAFGRRLLASCDAYTPIVLLIESAVSTSRTNQINQYTMALANEMSLGVLQRVAACCSVLQCVAVFCGVFQSIHVSVPVNACRLIMRGNNIYLNVEGAIYIDIKIYVICLIPTHTHATKSRFHLPRNSNQIDPGRQDERCNRRQHCGFF